MGGLTCYEDILIRSSDELHCFLAEERHVFIDGIVRDVFVRAVIESNQDIQQHYIARQQFLSFSLFSL